MSQATDSAILEVRSIRKAFGGAVALADASLSLRRGEVLALVGENGAGKSTLMKILAGVQPPDAGEVLVDGQPVRFASVADALARGIALISQELNLAENLSVAANLFLGRETTTLGPLGWLHHRPMNEAARDILARIGLDVSPDRLVGDLSPGQRQLVEIGRALHRAARVLIMDEPTSSLTQKETDRLLSVIAEQSRRGLAVVYISHRLAEVTRAADRAVVMRDGRTVGELPKGEITHESLVRMMVGRDLKQYYVRSHTPKPDAPIRLQLNDLTLAGGPSAGMSFAVRAGEIVGMAGLIGAGRTELAEALFGMRPVTGGTIALDGNAFMPRSPRDAVDRGLLLVPEDRRRHGLVLPESLRGNLSLPNLDRLNWLGLVNLSAEDRLARDTVSRLRVKSAGVGQAVGDLSGGNQQKVVLGKWLARKPSVLILDEPTRGVDVGAKSEIYALMDELAGQGVAVLMISSDLEEVLGMSDRVLVLHQGRLAGELARAELSEEAVMRLATGATQETRS